MYERNINKQLEDEKTNLRWLVDRAYEQAPLKKKILLVSKIKEYLKGFTSYSSLNRFENDDVMIVHSNAEDETGCVWVENSHTYIILLKIIYEKIKRENPYNKKQLDLVEKYFQDAANHEFDHVAKLVGKKDLNISYGVQFYKLNKKNVGIRLFINLRGRITKGEYFAHLLAPEGDNRSVSDNMPKLEKFFNYLEILKKLKNILLGENVIKH